MDHSGKTLTKIVSTREWHLFLLVNWQVASSGMCVFPTAGFPRLGIESGLWGVRWWVREDQKCGMDYDKIHYKITHLPPRCYIFQANSPYPHLFKGESVLLSQIALTSKPKAYCRLDVPVLNVVRKIDCFWSDDFNFRSSCKPCYSSTF